jgi:Kelch motif
MHNYRVLLADLISLVMVLAVAAGSDWWLGADRGALLAGRVGAGTPSGAGATAMPTSDSNLGGSPPTGAAAITSEPTTGLTPGTWSRVGDLPLAVWGQAAAVLSDGRVLTVGGTTGPNSTGAVASAEIYDPGTNNWTPVAPMGEARAYPCAVTLLDGTVLVVGGIDNRKVLASAERFDPNSGTWSSAGSMALARSSLTATVLATGQVLVAGGGTTSLTNAATNRAELFDPVHDTWTPTGSMSAVRREASATLLDDGRVLIEGGFGLVGGVSRVTSTAEIYDPGTGQWSLVAPMSTPRYAQASVRLLDGRVLVAGGWPSLAAAATSLPSTELFDPATGAWSSAGAMSAGRGAFGLVLLPDGRALAAGGWSPANTMLPIVDLFVPQLRSWTATGSLEQGVDWPTLETLRDGRVLEAGGATSLDAAVHVDGISSISAVYQPPSP